MSRKRIENKQAAVISRERIVSYLRQRYNPLINLTPEILRNQHAQFDAGYLRQFALTAEHIHEKDDMVKPVAGKREKAPGIRGYEIMAVDDSAEADRHVEVLTNFYNQLTTVNAADENERGGVNLLLRQMMLAVGYKYAVHEINWLPSGDGISAEFRYVPLWFFENTTGRLRLLQDDGSIQGVPLDEGSWLITVGDGLMKATSIAYMFKHLPLRDWLVYCGRHGMPGVAGKTSAAPDSAEWKKMEAAVADFAADFAAVMTTSDTIEAIDLTAKGELPWPKLVERMDRSISILWRGADLSTMASGAAQGTGATLQMEEMAIHDAADAAMLSEALNFYVDQWALWYHLGAVKPLAYIQIKTSLKKDTTADISLDKQLHDMGYPLDLQSMSERYNRPLPEDAGNNLQKATRPNKELPGANSKGFDPNQPRDEDGKWTDGGASQKGKTTDFSQYEQKIKRLIEIKTENYRKNGDLHPEVAAQFAVEGILHMIKRQPEYIDQLLDEEIEDALKAGAPSSFYAANARMAGPDSPELGQFLAAARMSLAEGVAADLAPVAESLANLLASTEGDEDADFRAKLAAWRDNELPMLAAQVLSDPAAAGKLADILSAAFALGVEEEAPL